MRVLGFAATVLMATSAPAAPASAVPANQIKAQSSAAPDQAQDLRAREDGHDRLTVPVRISGQGPYRFLIDTGANRTALSRQLAADLGLVSRDAAMLYSVTGQAQVGTVHVPLLDWTAQKVTDVNAALLDPSHMGADGILGLDSLRSQRILFNFATNTLTVVPSSERIREDPDAIVITGRARNGRLIFTDATAGRSDVTLIVDTGAEVSIGNDALRQELSRTKAYRAGGQVELQSVTGEKVVGDFMVVPELSVGGVTLRGLMIVFAPSTIFKQLHLDRKPAMLLGMNALRGFKKVSIDVPRRKLKVVLPEHSSLDGTAFASR